MYCVLVRGLSVGLVLDGWLSWVLGGKGILVGGWCLGDGVLISYQAGVAIV